MAINRTPVLKRCRQLGIDPVVLGYSSKKESIRQPKRRRKESEYAMQLREKQKAKFIYGVLVTDKAHPRLRQCLFKGKSRVAVQISCSGNLFCKGQCFFCCSHPF